MRNAIPVFVDVFSHPTHPFCTPPPQAVVSSSCAKHMAVIVAFSVEMRPPWRRRSVAKNRRASQNWYNVQPGAWVLLKITHVSVGRKSAQKTGVEKW